MRGSGKERQFRGFVFVTLRAASGLIRSSTNKGHCRAIPTRTAPVNKPSAKARVRSKGAGPVAPAAFAPVQSGGGTQVHAGPKNKSHRTLSNH